MKIIILSIVLLIIISSSSAMEGQLFKREKLDTNQITCDKPDTTKKMVSKIECILLCSRLNFVSLFDNDMETCMCFKENCIDGSNNAPNSIDSTYWIGVRQYTFVFFKTREAQNTKKLRST